MEIDPSEPDSALLTIHKSDVLKQSLATSSLSNSIAKLSASSRGIPSDKDFHFYYLYDEFRGPIDAIAAASQSLLEKIGDASDQFPFPQGDIDEGAPYDWLVKINDEILERVDSSLDEFLKMRKDKEEGKAAAAGVDEDGFMLVSGKKKRIGRVESGGGASVSEAAVRVVEKDKKGAGTGKAKIPFHISTIKRPQDEFNILVNNANKPFEHVWLQKSEDGLRCIHPLETLSVNDFVNRNTGEPQKPAPLVDTPFKLVETVKDLKEMAAKLRIADEIAVDLEHNQYRSFQGLTCLMQISTRTEDFVVDTLKLRVHIGPHLRELFKDPLKKKVMHGADRDVVWLQRDFGIYICNLFDTGQASRVLKLERNSLEYLLHYFCDVAANKEYQNAEWRLRPLPHEMIRYAREDTHYLLYIYDVMRARLLSESMVDENSSDLLLEVYQRSYDVCMQLYEKELLTETSYLHVYGLQTANFNAQQLAVASGLYEWRDVVARAEDESTGYILPNKILMEIAKQMPVTANKLKHMVRYKHPYIERNLSSVVNIIRHSIQHSTPFEAVVKQLADARLVVAPELVSSVGEEPVSVLDSTMVDKVSDIIDLRVGNGKAEGEVDSSLNVSPKVSRDNNDPNGSVDIQSARQNLEAERDSCEKSKSHIGPAKVTEATVQISKRPNRGFGAFLGSSTSKMKVNPSNKEKELTKLEQIKSSVNLQFHSFVGDDITLKKAEILPSERENQTSLNACKAPYNTVDPCPSEENQEMYTESKTEDIIQLEGNSDEDETPIKSTESASEHEETKVDGLGTPESGPDDEDELMSLSDLSTTFNKCLQSSNENQLNKSVGTSKNKSFQPFDYEEARKTIKFGEHGKRTKPGGNGDGSSSSKSGSKSKRGSERKQRGEEGEVLPQGRRRQAFPASGNKSATFL